MKPVFSRRFIRSYHKAPVQIQEKFDKQLGFLLSDINHPSLDVKLYDQENRTWQARVDRSWRFYFEIHGDEYHLMEIRKHPK